MQTTKDKRRKNKKRTHGTGAIITLPSGFYAFQYRGADGKKKTKSLKTKNRQKAEEEAAPLAEMLQAKDHAEAVQAIAKAREMVDNGSLPLDGVWEAYILTRPTAGQGTLDSDLLSLNMFIRWIRKNHPAITDYADIDEKTVKAWLIDCWAEGIAASTFNNRRGALRKITQALVDADKLKTNHWLKTASKRIIKQQKRSALSSDHAAELMKIETTAENHALLMLALFAGMRLVDAVSLQWENVKGRTIQYTPLKTERTSGVEVTVPILPPLQDALDALPRQSEYVVPLAFKTYSRREQTVKARMLKLIHSVTGDVKNKSTEGKVLRSIYGYHSLRHTFATEAARAGATAAELKTMTGDAIQTLSKYYVDVKIDQKPNPMFATIRQMALGTVQSEREELKRYAEELPLAEVKRLLAQIQPVIESK